MKALTLLAAAFIAGTVQGANPDSAETWRVCEFEFESQGAAGADVEMDAVFTRDCRTLPLRIPAFWDGGRTYRVRFAAPEAGVWTWCTESAAEKSLDGHAGRLEVKPYAGDLAIYRRGFVRPGSLKYFTYADGTPFLYLGDTHWGFGREAEDDATNAAAHHVETIVRRRVEQGFTVWQSEPLGCSFDLTDGTIDEKDIAGLRILDRAWKTVADAGLVHANAEFFFPSAMKPPLCEDEKALRRLARYWVARYGAYPVMWTLGQEADNDFYHDTKHGQKHWSATNNPYVKVAELIRGFDAYRHPLTAHQENTWETTVTGIGTKAGTNGGGSVFASAEVAKRCGHDWWGAQWSPRLNGPQRTEMLKDYWNDPRVAVNHEGRYCGLWTLDFGARAQAWISYLSGFRGYGYGAADLWLFKSEYDMAKPSSNEVEFISLEMKHTPWRQALEFASANQMRYFRDYMDAIPWWRLKPDLGTGSIFVPDSVTQGAAVAAADGTRLAIAYIFDRTGTASGSFTNLAALARYRLERFNPRDGRREQLGEKAAEAHGVIALPPRPDREDWVYSAKALDVDERLWVSLTFDDGPDGNLREVAPLLEKYGFRGMFNIVPQQIGTKGKLSWDEVRELKRRGHRIAAHGLTHCDLVSALKAGRTNDVVREIRESRAVLEKECGAKVEYFCYPFTRRNAMTDQLIREAGMRPMNVPRHNIGGQEYPKGTDAAFGAFVDRLRDIYGDTTADILFHGTSPTSHGWNPLKAPQDFENCLRQLAERVKRGTVKVVDYAELWEHRFGVPSLEVRVRKTAAGPRLCEGQSLGDRLTVKINTIYCR